MRSEDEICEMNAALAAAVVNTIHCDTFKCGHHMGKLEALAWVLGESRSGELQTEHDFESYQMELKATADEWREKEREQREKEEGEQT